MRRTASDVHELDKAVLNIIQQKRQTSADEIAKKVGYSTTTVRKSIDRLRKLHREIDCIRGVNGGIFWEQINDDKKGVCMQGKKVKYTPDYMDTASDIESQDAYMNLWKDYNDLKEKYDLLVQNSRSIERRVRDEYKDFVEPLVYESAKKSADEYKAKYDSQTEELNAANAELEKLHSKTTHAVNVNLEARYEDIKNQNIQLEAQNSELREMLIWQIERILELATRNRNAE